MAGDFENARGQYEKIMQMTWGRLNLGGSYTKSFYMLGKIHEQLEDKAKAIEYYEKALDLWKDADPGIPEVEDAKQRLASLTSH
jgi:tetratricopeptide (TPR) repeat protein